MKRIITLFALLVVLPFTLVTAWTPPAHSAEALTIEVYRTSTTTSQGESLSLGSIVIADSQYGLLLTPNLSGLTPGIHGLHIHQNPDCSAVEQDGKAVPGLAAGGHFDPDQTQVHAGPYAAGHLGDLPPLYVTDDGSVTTPVLAPRLQLSKVDQRSIMIHAGGDNFSDTPAPLGGGGARAACGVIRA